MALIKCITLDDQAVVCTAKHFLQIFSSFEKTVLLLQMFVLSLLLQRAFKGKVRSKYEVG